MIVNSPVMAPSPRHSGVLRMSGPQVGDTSISDEASSVGVRADTHRGIEQDPPRHSAPVGSSASFSIHYCNIRGLASNFSSVEQHLATSLPNLLLLSETQLSSDASSDLYNISNYGIIPRFRFKGGVCAYYNINTPITRLMNFESPNFDALWLRIFLPTKHIFLCFCYLSPNSADVPAFIDYLTSKHELLLSQHPNAEVIYAGDFNVHHTDG